jgi:phosphohistidine phosphatase
MRLVKRVLLLRHAKSSWKDATRTDHDRPLTGRGRRAAKAIGRHLQEQRPPPGLVLCSTAKRARETLRRIEPALGRSEVRAERLLYGASADALLERLRRLPDTVDSVLVIGHNPGLQELTLALADAGHARDRVAVKYPTAALVTLEFAGEHWRELEPGAAELVAFVRPRDLSE